MRDDLLFYYERELTFLRQMGAGFAEKYPKVAGRLLLEPGKCEDPHVERLLEAFSFLSARVHLKLDDEFPEVIEALLSVLYPQYLSPVPSMSVVQFHLDKDQGKLNSGHRLPRKTPLFSASVSGTPCQFRTCYDTTLWPLEVTEAAWKTPDALGLPGRIPNISGAISLRLTCLPDVSFQQLELRNLRFFIRGEGSLVNTLMELLCNSCSQLVLRDLAPASRKTVTLGAGSVKQVGYEPDEAVLPYPRRSFVGYRLLQEYFAFPEKFSFVDVSGFDKAAAAGFGSSLEILFLISEFERSDRRQMVELGCTAGTFALGCAPVVNLFPVVAEPILLHQKTYEYRIVPDARREPFLEIHSVDQVTGFASEAGESIEFRPLYSFRHAQSRETTHSFWHSTRKLSAWRKNGASDVFLTLVDLDGRMKNPDSDTVTVRLTCTNSDLPSRLPFGNENGDFQLESGGPISKIVTLVKPTEPLRPPSDHALLWRLVSQMSLNYLSLSSEGLEAFREILRLHNFGGSISSERQIQGLLDVRTSPHFTRLVSENGISFVRGLRVELDLDEENFVGSGVYTFCALLDVFLGLYSSVNSFSQLLVRTRQRKVPLKLWPPRSGHKPIL